jgi:beta-lactam-binding protein with PASTA domain
VIDVMATARGRGPALTAFRVTREVPVEVPDLGGLDVDAVQQKLGPSGLTADVQQRGGLLEELLPGEPAVCEQDPQPGAKVRRGTTVHVVVGKSC